MEFLQTELARRKVDLEPMSYGAPDLLFPQGMSEGTWDPDSMSIKREPLGHEETLKEYQDRQDAAIYTFVTEFLFIVKDDKIISILLIPKMANILGTLFYGRIGKLILWGPRGGGKSLMAAVFMFIAFIYLKRSCINMGGAGNQARRVYDYTKQFWHNFPGMQTGMLKREPLLQSSELKNGSQLTCATSVTTAIGEHVGIFVADEACTSRPGADHDLLRAMQGALSEPGHRVFLLSTFHLPTGFFADVWDGAEQMGFTKMSWDCFDIQEACTAGLEHATEEDPKAIESFCMKSCSLSWQRDVLDEFGNVVGQENVGCLGKARDSKGWQTREQVLDEQRINLGTRVFEVEHACIRPYSEGQIYNPKLVDACIVPFFNLRLDRPLVVGIDWGLTQCAVILIGEWSEGTLGQDDYREGIGMIDIVYMSNRLTQAVVDQIRRWQERFGELKHKHLGDPNGVEIVVRADGSHPYCNREVATNGYHVKPVYGDRKLLGEDNMSRWFASGLFKIVEGFGLFITQLHNLKRNTSTGKQVKKNLEGEEGDHGPDACKFAVMSYDFVKMFHKREKAIEDAKKAKERKLPSAKRRRGGLDSLLS
jgi:hypothetical protein